MPTTFKRRTVSPQYWLDRAEEAYTLSEITKSPNLRALLHGIGVAYERQALVAEQQLAAEIDNQKAALTIVK